MAMAILPVWEHSEVKWWRKKIPEVFRGKPKGWRVGENGMGKWRLQKLCYKEPFLRPQGAFVFFAGSVFEKKKSDI